VAGTFAVTEIATELFIASMAHRIRPWLQRVGTREIADEVRSAAPASSAFADTSVWVTVQGRVVYVEGCARSADAEARIEAFVRGLPHVQQAIAILRTDPRARAPYRLRHPVP
jgi:osmotically-inducible protein OsmY